MTGLDVTMVSPYPCVGTPRSVSSGVASYTERLTTALAEQGVRIRVLAPEVEGEPRVTRTGGVTVERTFRRGTAALPVAAAAAGRRAAPIVHVQHETFLFGGPSSVPGVAPALIDLRRRHLSPVVTMHQVVDPGAVTREFTRVHRVKVPHRVARVGMSALQRSVRAFATATVVLEDSFTSVVPDAYVVPHGIDVQRPTTDADARSAKERLGLDPRRLTALCFGFIAPYKGLEIALQAAALAGDTVELVVAGGSHPRLHGRDAYADDLRRDYAGHARFTGYVPDDDVGNHFRAADVLLLPYPSPFASSGPLAQSLGYGTPVLCSAPLARCVGAPPALVMSPDAAGLADRLRELAAEPGRLRDLGCATRSLAAGRSWSDVARRHVALYEEVMHARRPAGRRVRSGESGR